MLVQVIAEARRGLQIPFQAGVVSSLTQVLRTKFGSSIRAESALNLVVKKPSLQSSFFLIFSNKCLIVEIIGI